MLPRCRLVPCMKSWPRMPFPLPSAPLRASDSMRLPWVSRSIVKSVVSARPRNLVFLVVPNRRPSSRSMPVSNSRHVKTAPLPKMLRMISACGTVLSRSSTVVSIPGVSPASSRTRLGSRRLFGHRLRWAALLGSRQHRHIPAFPAIRTRCRRAPAPFCPDLPAPSIAVARSMMSRRSLVPRVLPVRTRHGR